MMWTDVRGLQEGRLQHLTEKDTVIATDTVAMLVLAGSVAAGYFVIGLVIAPKIRMPSASPKVVSLVRAAAMVFFVACGLTHLHIVVHTLGLGGSTRPVEGHDLGIHVAQAVGAWLFIVGAALKLELHVVPSARASTQRDEARAQLAEQQLITTALKRGSAMTAALARISEHALSYRDLDALARDAATVVRGVLPDGCVVTIAEAGDPVPSGPGDALVVAHDDAVCDRSDEEFVRSLNNVLASAVRRLHLEETLRDRSLHDALTGLANRWLFTEQLEHEWAQHQRHGRGLAVIALDLDDFKTINDRLGHQAGDDLLVEVARRLRGCAREGDTVARVGGDEYTIILPETSLVDAEDVAQRVRRALGAPLAIAGEHRHPAASIGIAAVAERQHAPDDLLREADAAMYAAKATKAGLVCYAPGIEAAATMTLPSVDPGDAAAWAHYLRTLQLEIADRNLTGEIAAQSRAPASLHRVLEQILAAIDQLPTGVASASLVLPRGSDLEEFVFHHTAVQHWADALVRQGVLSARRTLGADRFWAHLQQQLMTPATLVGEPATAGS